MTYDVQNLDVKFSLFHAAEGTPLAAGCNSLIRTLEAPKEGSAVPEVAFAVAEPARHGHLLLGEELHAFPALHVQVAEKGFPPAVERELWHKYRKCC
jgi:hypothetical protein